MTGLVPVIHVATWLAVLKEDKKAIFTAASKASEAAGFLASLRGAESAPGGQELVPK